MPVPEPGHIDFSDGRLDSWKEVASYVNRTVSTVKRWERDEGLPVHRQVHKTQGSVYAYKTEIDAWRQKRNQAPKGKQATVRRSSWKPLTTAFGALLAVLLLTWLIFPLEQGTARSDSNVKPRIWVLVSDFENRTSESLFDGTLSYAMKGSLSSSALLAVVPQERIDDALRLMKKPLDTPIDPALAGEICLRDGEIDVIVAGQIESASTALRLSVSIIDPAGGETVGSRSMVVSESSAILRAVEELGEWTRNSLGEDTRLGKSSRHRLEKATTESLKALQLYSRGMQMGYRNEWAGAQLLFESAIKEDPNFASAQIMLAWAVRNQTPPLEQAARKVEYMRPAQRALELSVELPDRERLWIEASYLTLDGRGAEAAAPYEALLSLYSDHYWALCNLSAYYYGVRHRDHPLALARSIRYSKDLADLRPNSFNLNANTAVFLNYLCSDFDGALAYARRAQSLTAHLPLKPTSADAFLAVAVRVIPTAGSFVDGDPQPLLEALRRMESDCTSEFKPSLGWYYLQLGQIRKAESLLRLETNPVWRHLSAAELAYALNRGEVFREELRHFLESQKRKPILARYVAALLVRAGLLEEAEAGLKVARSAPSDPEGEDAVKALLALSRGEIEKADRLMEAALSCPVSRPVYLLAAEAQAESLQMRDRPGEAVGVLERALMHRGAIAFYSHYAWRLEVRLSRLYRSLGRIDEAKVLEDRLLKRLSLADPDHPAIQAVHRGTPWPD